MGRKLTLVFHGRFLINSARIAHFVSRHTPQKFSISPGNLLPHRTVSHTKIVYSKTLRLARFLLDFIEFY